MQLEENKQKRTFNPLDIEYKKLESQQIKEIFKNYSIEDDEVKEVHIVGANNRKYKLSVEWGSLKLYGQKPEIVTKYRLNLNLFGKKVYHVFSTQEALDEFEKKHREDLLCLEYTKEEIEEEYYP